MFFVHNNYILKFLVVPKKCNKPKFFQFNEEFNECNKTNIEFYDLNPCKMQIQILLFTSLVM